LNLFLEFIICEFGNYEKFSQWDNYAIISGFEKSSFIILSSDGTMGDKPVRSHLRYIEVDQDVKKCRNN